MDTAGRASRIVNPRLPVATAIGLAAGICAALSFTTLGAAAAAAAALMLAAVNALTVRRSIVFIFVLAFLLGMARIFVSLPDMPAEGAAEITGIVADAPSTTDRSTVYDLRRVTLGGGPVSGHILLTVYGDSAPAAACGDMITADCRVSLPDSALNDGGFDNRKYLLSKGVAAYAYAAEATLTPRPGGAMRAAASVRLALTDTIDALYPQNAGLIKGILLGDTSGIDREILEDYRNTGMAHILALSGLHISILTGILSALLRRLRPWLRCGLITLFVAAYLFVTGFPVSLLRAGIMTLILFGARLAGRRYDSLCSIGAAATVILLILPYSVYSVGFVLSFAACTGITLLSPAVTSLLKRLPSKAVSWLAVPTGAILGVAPFSAAYFGKVCPAALLGSILLLPLIYVILAPALPIAALCCVLPGAARAAASILDIAGGTLNFWVARLSELRFASIAVPAPSAAVILLTFALYFTVSRFLMVKRRVKTAAAACCAALIVILTVAAVPRNEAAILVCDGGGSAVICTDGRTYVAVSDGDFTAIGSYLAHRGLGVPDGVVCVTRADAETAAAVYPGAAIAALTPEAALAAAECGIEPMERLPFVAAAADGVLRLSLGGAETVLDGKTAYINGTQYSLEKTGRLKIKNCGSKTVVTAYTGGRNVIE